MFYSILAIFAEFEVDLLRARTKEGMARAITGGSKLRELVLLEASSVGDLTTWLDRDALVHMWPRLYLPRVVRAAWEERHPALRERGASPYVPQP